jgi:DNA-directed RNA polymerase II subunit RPB3
MKVSDYVEVSKNFATFTLNNTKPSIANALRRVMISEVPTLCIEYVNVYENSTVMHMNYIAHRLGLIVLSSEMASQFLYPDECYCESGCHQCTFTFNLDVSCDSDQDREILASDLVPEKNNSGLVHVCQPETVIMKICKGQRLHLEAIVKKGIGKDHAKFSSACGVTFKPNPIVEIGNDAKKLSQEDLKAVASKCVTGEIQYVDGKLEVVDPLKCRFDEEYIKYCDEELGLKDVVRVSMDESTYLFKVESTGALSAKELVKRACNILARKFKTMENTIKMM